MLYNKLQKIVTSGVMFMSFLLSSCSAQISGERLTPKVKALLENKHGIHITDMRLNMNKHAGNFADKEFSYSGRYTSAELGYREAHIKLWNDEPIQFVFDSFLQNKLGYEIDQTIERNLSAVDFVIYVQVMDMLNPSDELLKQPMSKVKKPLFKDKNITVRVLVSAPDLKTNREKYLQFHIDLMRELKAQHIEKAKLYINFFDEGVDISNFRFNTQKVIVGPLDDHMIERWSSIHNNKWYDLVKDHPDKVLKYGKVFTYK